MEREKASLSSDCLQIGLPKCVAVTVVRQHNKATATDLVLRNRIACGDHLERSGRMTVLW
jgi:hypothetical protein